MNASPDPDDHNTLSQFPELARLLLPSASTENLVTLADGTSVILEGEPVPSVSLAVAPSPSSGEHDSIWSQAVALSNRRLPERQRLAEPVSGLASSTIDFSGEDVSAHLPSPTDVMWELVRRGVPAHLARNRTIEDLARAIRRRLGTLACVNIGALFATADWFGDGGTNGSVAVPALARETTAGRVVGVFVQVAADQAPRFVPVDQFERAWLDTGGWVLTIDIEVTPDR